MVSRFSRRSSCGHGVMFYRVKGQGVGYGSAPTVAGHISKPLHQKVKQIELAFEQFGKQVRVGSFVLPNQLTVKEDK